MKVRLIKEGLTGPNPDFDRSLPVSPNNPEETARPVGLEIDHPDAHFLCYGAEPNAEPVDAEAKAMFDKYMAQRATALKSRAVNTDEGIGSDRVDDPDSVTESPASGSVVRKRKARLAE